MESYQDCWKYNIIVSYQSKLTFQVSIYKTIIAIPKQYLTIIYFFTDNIWKKSTFSILLPLINISGVILLTSFWRVKLYAVDRFPGPLGRYHQVRPVASMATSHGIRHINTHVGHTACWCLSHMFVHMPILMRSKNRHASTTYVDLLSKLFFLCYTIKRQYIVYYWSDS